MATNQKEKLTAAKKLSVSRIAKLTALADQAREVTTRYMGLLTSLEDLVAECVKIVLDARSLHYAPQSQNEKAIGFAPPGRNDIPDWGGRSPEYTAWKKSAISEVIASVVADEDEQARIEQNLVAKAVQRELVKRAEGNEKLREQLLLLSVSVETAQARAKRLKAEKDAANAERRDREAAEGTGLVNESLVSEATDQGAKPQDDGSGPMVPVTALADAVAAYVSALLTRLNAEVIEKLSKGERDHLAQMLGRVEVATATIRERLGQESAIRAVAASGVKIEVPPQGKRTGRAANRRKAA